MGPYVRILQVPSPSSDAWLEAIQNRCFEEGWSLLLYWGGALPQLPSGPSVIVGWAKDDLFPVTDWIVQTCEPALAIDALAAKMKLSLGEARYHASARFAMCSELAGAGAAVYDANKPLIIPGLGEIGGPERLADGRREGSLSLYENIPPRAGVSTSWAADVFSILDLQGQEASEVRIELVGRRRLLLNGPHLSLPPGKWQAKAQISVEPKDAVELLIEWGSGTEVKAQTFLFDAAGSYEIDFVHIWAKSAPADFRISLMTPVLDGWLDFKGITITRIGPV